MQVLAFDKFVSAERFRELGVEGVDIDELYSRADLITILNTTPGVEDLNSTTFLPAADVSVGPESLPLFVSLSLRDSATGQVINDVVAVSF